MNSRSYSNRTTTLAFVVLITQAFIASSPLFANVWFNSHDAPTHLVRLNNICYEMINGDFYPRWLSEACLGKGSPVLNFYAPGFYLIVGYLHTLGLSIIPALITFCLFLFFVGSWGMFIWTRKHFGFPGALLSASVYMFAPYHFVDIYVRGALPEFFAIQLLPFLFHAIDLSLNAKQHRYGILLTSITTAAVILTHNLSALMIFPFALLYFAWCSFSAEVPRIQILSACAGPLLGIGMSAFYWLPLSAEAKHLANLGSMKSGYFKFSDHFVRPIQWFSSSWGFGGAHEDMSFQIGYTIVFCVAAAILILLIKPHNDYSPFGSITLILSFLALFMMTPLSSPIYKFIPIVRFVQFPWRFLGPATLFLAAFCGLISTHELARRNQWFSWILCLIVIVACVTLSGSQRKVASQLPVPLEPADFRKYARPLFAYWREEEFMPKWAKLSSTTILSSPVIMRNNELTTPITDFAIKGSSMKCKTTATQASQIVTSWFYFPGWKAKVDGSSVPVYSSPEGLASVSIPPGEHSIEVWFGTTVPRLFGWVIAAVSFAVTCCIAVGGMRDNRRKLIKASLNSV